MHGRNRSSKLGCVCYLHSLEDELVIRKVFGLILILILDFISFFFSFPHICLSTLLFRKKSQKESSLVFSNQP